MLSGPPLESAQRAVLVAVARDEVDRAVLFARSMRNRAELGRLWDSGPEGFAEIELAGTGRIGQLRAGRQLDDAQRLADILTGTLALLESGVMYVPVAELLLSMTRMCPEQVQAEVERRVLTRIATSGTTDVRRLLEQVIPEVEADLDPDLTRQRLENARKDRGVWVAPMPDGMCQVGASLDVLTGRRWALDFEELVRAQRMLDRRDGIVRTQAQRRADVFAQLPGRLIALLQAVQQGRVQELLDLAAADPDAAASIQVLADATGDLASASAVATVWDLARDPATAETGADETVADETVTGDGGGPSTTCADGSTAMGDGAASSPGGDAPEDEPGEQDLLPTRGWNPWPWDEPCPEGVTRAPEPLPPAPPVPAPAAPLFRTWDLQELAVACLRLTVRDPRVIDVHIPMTTLLELDNRTGWVEGLGPVPALLTRMLLPVAGLRRIYVDPRSGVPLGTDPTVHQPPAASSERGRVRLLSLLGPAVLTHSAAEQHDPSGSLQHLVQLRDQRCTGIGCSRRASACDLDHEQAYPAGPTAEWNISSKSRRCHRAKHAGWVAHRADDGSSTWTSPLGHSYTRPGVWMAPTPVPVHLQLPPAADTPLDVDEAWPLELPLWPASLS